MKKLVLLIYILSFGIYSCSESPDSSSGTDTDGSVTEDSSSTLSRTLEENVSPLTLEKAFIKMPANLLSVELLRELSVKERRALVRNGELNGMISQLSGGSLIIKEPFENEDDPQAQAYMLILNRFVHVDGKTILLASVYQRQRPTSSQAPQLKEQLFLEYTGKEWEKASYQIPNVNLQDFFDNETELPEIDELHIAWQLSTEDPSLLIAQIQFSEYNDKDIIRPLITQQAYQVSLYWDGVTFEKQRTPLE